MMEDGVPRIDDDASFAPSVTLFGLLPSSFE